MIKMHVWTIYGKYYCVECKVTAQITDVLATIGVKPAEVDHIRYKK